MIPIHQIEPVITQVDIEAVTTYLQSGGWLTEFKKTELFEKQLARVLDVPYVIMCTSGTVGLYLALLAAGIGTGHSVLVPNYTMIATINAVTWTGAIPVIVDIDQDTLCLDINKIPVEKFDAMLYVDINGRSGNILEIRDFCKNNSIILIEDACQSFGSRLQDKCIGTFGDLGVFSLTPHKIITTGQGGFVCTKSETYYNKIKSLKDFGRVSPGKDIHTSLGFNFKFTDLQAALGISQLATLDDRLEKKLWIHREYWKRLKDLPIRMLEHHGGSVPWFIELLVSSGDLRYKLIEYLKSKSIGTRRFYPAISSQRLYGGYGRFPVSEYISPRGLWLPSSISLQEEQIDYICDHIKRFFDGN